MKESLRSKNFFFIWSNIQNLLLLFIVSLGAMGDVKGAKEILKDVPGLLKKKNNQIEAFVARRVR